MPPFLTSLTAKLIAAGVAALLLTAAGAYAGYRFELGKYESLVAADAQAMTKAVKLAADKQHQIDLGNQKDAVAEAYFRGTQDAMIVNLKLEAPANVTVTQDAQAAAADHAGCVTFGFMRLLVAGERGVPADSLDYPSGESADTCTALKPSDVASAVSQDLNKGTSNGHQLDSLIAAVKRNDAIATAKP